MVDYIGVIYCLYICIYIDRKRKRKYGKAADKKRDQYSFTFDILKMSVHAR